MRMRYPPAKDPVRRHRVPSRRRLWFCVFASKLASLVAWSRPSLGLLRKGQPDVASAPVCFASVPVRLEVRCRGCGSHSYEMARYEAGALSKRHGAGTLSKSLFIFWGCELQLWSGRQPNQQVAAMARRGFCTGRYRLRNRPACIDELASEKAGAARSNHLGMVFL